MLEGGVNVGPTQWHKSPSLAVLLMRYYSKAVGSTLTCCAFDNDPEKLGGWSMRDFPHIMLADAHNDPGLH